MPGEYIDNSNHLSNDVLGLLQDKNLNKTQLKEMAQISTNAVAKMGKNESVSMETLGKVCCALKCEIGDIIEIYEVKE